MALSPNNSLKAQDATDNASDSAYDDGFDAGDNGGANFIAWTQTLTEAVPLTDSASAVVIDATSVGGDSSLNNGGRAWALLLDAVAILAAGNASRDFTSLIAGGKIQFRVQYIGDEISITGAQARVGDGNTLLFNLQIGTTNWQLNSGAGLSDTGIPISSPIEVLATHNSTANFDITVSELISPFDEYTASAVAYASAGTPDRLVFSAGDLNLGVPTYFLINNLIVNPDGTLPVELSAFGLE